MSEFQRIVNLLIKRSISSAFLLLNLFFVLFRYRHAHSYHDHHLMVFVMCFARMYDVRYAEDWRLELNSLLYEILKLESLAEPRTVALEKKVNPNGT